MHSVRARVRIAVIFYLAATASVQADDRLLDIRYLTQAQADVASDCDEALWYERQPMWRLSDADKAAFDRYCPVFGYKAPFGTQTKAFNEMHSKVVMKALRERFENVPSITRQYDGPSRSPDFFYDAQSAMRR